MKLFNYLVGLGNQCRRHDHTERLGSCQVDEELKSGGLLHGQVSGFVTFQNPIHVNRCAASHRTLVNSIGDKTSSLNKLPYIAAARQITRKCEVRYHFPGLKDQTFSVSDHPLHASLYHGVKCGLEVAERAYLESLGIDAELDPGLCCLLNIQTRYFDIWVDEQPNARDRRDNLFEILQPLRT